MSDPVGFDKSPLPACYMTLRDWLAGQALAVVAAYETVRRCDAIDESIAEWAYDIADAMMVERERKR